MGEIPARRRHVIGAFEMNDTLHAIFTDFDKIYNAAAKSVLPPLSPSPKPEPQDTDSQTLNGCGGFPMTNSLYGDEE